MGANTLSQSILLIWGLGERETAVQFLCLLFSTLPLRNPVPFFPLAAGTEVQSGREAAFYPPGLRSQGLLVLKATEPCRASYAVFPRRELPTRHQFVSTAAKEAIYF